MPNKQRLQCPRTDQIQLASHYDHNNNNHMRQYRASHSHPHSHPQPLQSHLSYPACIASRNFILEFPSINSRSRLFSRWRMRARPAGNTSRAGDKFGCRACVNVMHAGQERWVWGARILSMLRDGSPVSRYLYIDLCSHLSHSLISFKLATKTKVSWQKTESLLQVHGVHSTPHFYLQGGSIGLMVWQFGSGFDPPKSPLPLGVRDPHLTQCVIGSHNKCTGTCQVVSESIERFRQGAWMWQTTDHAMEKRVGIGGIACAARAIPPNNT